MFYRFFKSSSTVEMPPNPNFSTKTLSTFGETKAGSVIALPGIQHTRDAIDVA